MESSISLLEDYGLDGLDVDYEYPSNDEQAKGYTELLKELRHGLDEHAKSKAAEYKFLLTVRVFFQQIWPRFFILHAAADRGPMRSRQL